MIKSKALTFIACTLFAAPAAFAGGKACCATQVSNKDKTECSEAFAKFNLAPDQKTKLDVLQAQCEKEGCTEASMKKFMKGAEGVLSKDQYAHLKTECAQEHESKETKS
jgi:hypothetical protein